MIRLRRSLDAWGTPDFAAMLCDELQQLDPEDLALQQGLSRGSYALGDGLGVMLLGVDEGPESISARAGLFFTAVIAGCSCADDPTPVEAVSEYCEVRIDVDKTTAEARVTLLG